MTREITAVDEIDAALEDAIADHAIDWLGEPGDRDWEDYLGRLETHLDLYLPNTMVDPVIRKVQKIARDAWREANE